MVLIKNVFQLEDIRRIDNLACDAAACEEGTVKIMVKHDTCETKGTYVKSFKKGIVNRDAKKCTYREKLSQPQFTPSHPPSKLGNKIERNFLGL